MSDTTLRDVYVLTGTCGYMRDTHQFAIWLEMKLYCEIVSDSGSFFPRPITCCNQCRGWNAPNNQYDSDICELIIRTSILRKNWHSTLEISWAMDVRSVVMNCCENTARALSFLDHVSSTELFA